MGGFCGGSDGGAVVIFWCNWVYYRLEIAVNLIIVLFNKIIGK
jgi:hypothetical protein